MTISPKVVTTELGSHPNQTEGLSGNMRIANKYMTIHTANHVIHHCRFFLMNAVTFTSFHRSLFSAIDTQRNSISVSVYTDRQNYFALRISFTQAISSASNLSSKGAPVFMSHPHSV